MINKKEITSIIISVIILGFVVALSKELENFSENIFYAFLMIFIILILNIFSKKAMAHYLDSEVEIKLWELERIGFFGTLSQGYLHPSKKFKKPFPIGAVLPVVISIISMGYVKWLASLVFDVKASVHRAAKRHGLYTFSEMTEYHIGLIAASGIIINLLGAIVSYFLGFEEFTRLSLYFVFFNMLPISEIDGNKIFFGSLILWSFLAALAIIGLVYSIFMI
jgi:hypothetical protein